MDSLTAARNFLLAALPPEERVWLERQAEAVPLERGEILHEQGDELGAAYFPFDGMISLVTVLNKSGKVVETAIIGREGALGATACFGPQQAFRRAMVQVAGSAARIPAARLREATERSAALRTVLGRYNEVLLAQAQQIAACNAFHEAEERLARWLLQTHDRVDSDTVPLTQELLAQMLGVRRTTVTLIALTLQERGLLRYRRGRIEIVNRAGLEGLACECYSAMRHQLDHYFPAIERAEPEEVH